MKLSFKQKSSLFALIALWPIDSILIAYISNILNIELFSGLDNFLKVILYILTGLITTVIMIICINSFSPLVKGQNAIMTELEQNGYTMRFIELTEAEINRIISSGKVYKLYRYFSQYVRFQADCYLYVDNVNAALSSIGRINLKDMQTYLKGLDSNAFLGYFDVQMAISEELNDPARAYAVMQDAQSYLQKEYGKSVGGDLIANEIYCQYYLTVGNYSTALEYAQRCLVRASIPFCTFLGNALSFKVYIKEGLLAQAATALTSAEKAATSCFEKQAIAKLRNELKNAQSTAGI